MDGPRVGFVGIVMEDRAVAPRVNELIAVYAQVVKARVGVPDSDGKAAVIGLIVEGTNDALGALTAKLGNLPGVQVKSALTQKKNIEKEA